MDKTGAEPRSRRARAVTLLLFVLAGSGCGERSDLRVARRILDNHRKSARVKPLPGAQVIRLQLTATAGRDAAAGNARVE